VRASTRCCDRDYKIRGDDLTTQTIEAFKNIARALEALGAEPSDALSSTAYS